MALLYDEVDLPLFEHEAKAEVIEHNGRESSCMDVMMRFSKRNRSSAYKCHRAD